MFLFWNVIVLATTCQFLSLNLGQAYIIAVFLFYNDIMFKWKQGSKLATFHHFFQIVRVTYNQQRTNFDIQLHIVDVICIHEFT